MKPRFPVLERNGIPTHPSPDREATFRGSPDSYDAHVRSSGYRSVSSSVHVSIDPSHIARIELACTVREVLSDGIVVMRDASMLPGMSVPSILCSLDTVTAKYIAHPKILSPRV